MSSRVVATIFWTIGLFIENEPNVYYIVATSLIDIDDNDQWEQTRTRCYVAICDRRNLWQCRNLWLKVSQFVTDVAICDGKCRNLWQRQNMQFNDIYSLNFDQYFVLSSYLY